MVTGYSPFELNTVYENHIYYENLKIYSTDLIKEIIITMINIAGI